MVGRNYAYQTGSGATAFFEDAKFNPFAAAGSLGVAADDFNSDNFDHGPHGFVGGASLTCAYTNGRPIAYHPTPPGTPTWGSKWKKAVSETYQRVTSVGAQGSVMSYRNNYLDLDPTYKDPLGRPLMRMTFDYQDNERKMASYMADRCNEIAHTMGAKHDDGEPAGRSVVGGAVSDHAQHRRRHHGQRPDAFGAEPVLQTWDVPNVFVTGASAFPQNAGYNPDRYGGGADLLGAGCDPEQIPEEPRPPGAGMSVMKRAALALVGLLFASGVRADPDDYGAVMKGRALATAGDCVACHTAPGGVPFAGGLGLETPFGTIVTPNITPDDGTGHRPLVRRRFRPRDA